LLPVTASRDDRAWACSSFLKDSGVCHDVTSCNLCPGRRRPIRRRGSRPSCRWGGGPPIEALRHKEIREFLNWVHERALAEEGTNPGRTANKAREHLRAVLSWAWEQELIEAPPRLPGPREQRDIAGRHYLTKAEINALYFATHQMKRPRGWDSPFSVGRHWRAALVVFFNYGVDTGTVWKSAPLHEPILWRHLTWEPQSPDRELQERSRWGWLFYRRVKTGKSFYRPMNHVVHAHLQSILPENVIPDGPVFLGGGARPNARFHELCALAGIRPRTNVETGVEEPWELKDLRKTCATYHDEHLRSPRWKSWATRSGASPTGTTPTAPRWRSRRS
jgi:hypothetical protein